MKHTQRILALLVTSTFAFFLLSANTGCSGSQEKETKSNSQLENISTTTNDADRNEVTKDASEQKKGEIIQLTDDNFDDEINSGIVLVDFWATWCGPCRMQAPILEKVNTEMEGKVTIAKLDVDKNHIISDRYGVLNIPTLIIFNKGKQVKQFVGLTQKEEIISALNKELK